MVISLTLLCDSMIIRVIYDSIIIRVIYASVIIRVIQLWECDFKGIVTVFYYDYYGKIW